MNGLKPWIQALVFTSLALNATGLRCYECVYTRDLGEYNAVFGKSDEKCQNPVRRHSVERNGTSASGIKTGPGMDGKGGGDLVPTCVKMEALVVRQVGHLKAALGPVIIRTVRMYPKDQPLICENTNASEVSNWSDDRLANKIDLAKGRLCLCRVRIPPNWKPECNGGVSSTCRIRRSWLISLVLITIAYLGLF